ncbi:hypothetical protein [Hymenobacter cheonanensis]|uniref:hypothetical protein n=1 Tax=Hymenobacter sp. CA2-7 TaxID=3063993 RepID=UPI002712A654|nr:hypothetical protein [Hymenobacter sp. CA2-7]MDO7886705.1 hypothetical protein [Hymenobacter sp. CA2-7]
MLTRLLCRVRGLFRRWLPALLALLLCAAYYQYTAGQERHRVALAAAVTAGRLNADSPEVASAHNVAVPPFGLVAGKFLFGLGLFFGGLAAVWFVMRFVVPVLPRWATKQGGYKVAFYTLPDAQQLRTFNLIWLGLLGYFALCVLAACLVS